MAGRPKMCGSCGKLMGVVDVCPYCGADNRKVSVRLKRAAKKAEGSGTPTPVTVTFVGVNVFFFLVALLVGGVSPSSGGLEIASPDIEVMFSLGLQYNPAIDAGDWWRLIMPVFLHLGVLHVFFNTYILWVAGRHVELEIGPRLMFLVYMAAGILGFVASYFADIGGAGASGAVSGLLGFLIVRRRLVDGHFKSPITVWVIQLIVLTAVFGLVVSRVNNVAHLVGFLSGAGLAFVLTRVRIGRRGALAIMVSTTAIGLVTLAAVGSMVFALGRGTSEDLRLVARCVDSAQAALVDGGRAVSPEAAERAAACFESGPSLGGAGEDARRDIARFIGAAAAANREGSTGAEQEATSQVRRAIFDFTNWFHDKRALYGL